MVICDFNYVDKKYSKILTLMFKDIKGYTAEI